MILLLKLKHKNDQQSFKSTNNVFSVPFTPTKLHINLLKWTLNAAHLL